MVKLNRTTEYGLLALSYIRYKPSGLSSAREIAEHFELPFEILAKTLQRLKEEGIVNSSYGTHGGYALAKDLNALNLGDFLEIMEGPFSIVTCTSTQSKTHRNSKLHDCEYRPKCTIHKMMGNLHWRVYDFLNRISLEELTRNSYDEVSVKPVVHGEEP